MKSAPKPIIHTFKEINTGKYKSVKHFELLEIKNGSNQLTSKINLSKDRGFAKSNPDYWVKTWRGDKWSTKTLTGLFRTNHQDIYFGYEGKKEHLILFKIKHNQSSIKSYYFKNYYTDDLTSIIGLTK